MPPDITHHNCVGLASCHPMQQAPRGMHGWKNGKICRDHKSIVVLFPPMFGCSFGIPSLHASSFFKDVFYNL